MLAFWLLDQAGQDKTQWLVNRMNTDLHLLGVTYADLDDCHLNLLRGVRKSAEAISSNSILAIKGRALNQHFYGEDGSFRPFRFEQKYQISPGPFPQAAKANAIVNLFGTCDQECGQLHLAAVEWCADNRVAIGTNLLKFEFLRRRFAPEGSLFLGVVIGLDSDLIIAAGMSSAVAATAEYRLHFEELYESVITAPLALINLRD